MPRQITLTTHELGKITAYFLRERNGVWEQGWDYLREHPVGQLFVRITQETYNHAIAGWSAPLIKVLGLPPEGCLRKLPDVMKQCAKRSECLFYNKRVCHPVGKNMPWCYLADGVEDHTTQQLITRAIEMWREGAYVFVVVEPG